MKKGFTLIEMIVVIVILFAILLLVMGGAKSCSAGDSFIDTLRANNPQWERIRVEREKAEAIREQNELLRRTIEERSIEK